MGLGRYASTVGAWPSGKATVFGTVYRRFESYRPSQIIQDVDNKTGSGQSPVFFLHSHLFDRHQDRPGSWWHLRGRHEVPQLLPGICRGGGRLDEQEKMAIERFIRSLDEQNSMVASLSRTARGAGAAVASATGWIGSKLGRNTKAEQQGIWLLAFDRKTEPPQPHEPRERVQLDLSPARSRLPFAMQPHLNMSRGAGCSIQSNPGRKEGMVISLLPASSVTAGPAGPRPILAPAPSRYLRAAAA